MGRRKGPPLTRVHVVQAALAVVREEGPAALGVSRVARELGIRPPSLYNHVGSGEALAQAAVTEATRRLLTHLRASLDDVSEPRAQLLALAHAVRHWVGNNPGWYALMARVEPDNDHPEFGPVVRDMLSLFGRPLEQLGVPPESRVHALRGLRSAVHGFVLLEASGQFQLPEDLDESFRRMVEAMLRGVEGTVF
ncbi:MAG: TetR/AcrR family transcriptional regulator [Sandaracinaceae bacterium]